MKTKDNSVIEEDSCVCGINDTIDALIIEGVDSYDLVQSIWSPITGYSCTDWNTQICLFPLLVLASNIVNDKL